MVAALCPCDVAEGRQRADFACPVAGFREQSESLAKAAGGLLAAAQVVVNDAEVA